jgi:hypothetical protein
MIEKIEDTKIKIGFDKLAMRIGVHTVKTILSLLKKIITYVNF